MVIKRFFEEQLAQASYLVGCAASGRALVIDPLRDADFYVREAAQDGLHVSDVTETHIHADFLSGSRELAARTGATLHLSDEGDAAWKYAFGREARLLKSGDVIQVGKVRVEAVHTPGHTPEHLSFLITDGAVATVPIAAATGDFIFVGDVGRPDLLERAAHLEGTMAESARTLYRALHAFERGHEDWLQIWPGHGAGSSCGKGISAVPHTTLGYERRFNWAFRVSDEAAFVEQALAGQPEPPPYFAIMKRLNKAGPALLGGLPRPAPLDSSRLAAIVEAGSAGVPNGRTGPLIIDARPADAFFAGHLPGTINIPFNRSFTTWAGWLVSYDSPFYLVADAERAAAVARALCLIGLDNLAGYVVPEMMRFTVGSGGLEQTRQMEVAELQTALDRGAVTLVDVRNASEWEHGHVPGALHIPLGHLEARLSELPPDRPVVTQCQSGGRSAIAASLLQRAGHKDAINLQGGYAAWTALAADRRGS